MSATALFDRSSGRAIIADGNKTYTLDVNDTPQLKEVNGPIHLGMFLQPAMAEIEQQDIGACPYPKFIQYLTAAHRQECCLAMLLISVDGGFSLNLRKSAAGSALLYLKNSEVRRGIIKLLREKPLPQSADTAGLPDDQLREFLSTNLQK